MKRRNRILAAAAVGAVFACGMAIRAVAHPCDLPSDKELDQMMFQVVDGATSADLLAAVQIDWPEVDWTVLDQEQQRGYYYVQVFVPESWTEVEWELFEDSIEEGYPSIATWLEFLSSDEAPEGGTGSTFVDGIQDLAVYKEQYAAIKLGLTTAHAMSTGASTVVAVLDSGIDATHTAFAGRLLPGWDFVDGDASPDDVSPGQDLDGDGLIDEMAGHGTFSAGLVALVAPDARILPIRILDPEGHGDSWHLARGIWYAIDHGVEVINLSLGSTEDSDIVEEALDEAASLGITVVAAAGNCSRTEPEEFPAMTENGVIGVAGVDDTDVHASFTNFHQTLMLSAPAVSYFDAEGLPMLDRSMVSSLPGGDYGVWQGTSIATPLVAGAAALVRSQHPEWDAVEATGQSVAAVLVAGAVNVDALNPGFAGLLGQGRIDAASAAAIGPAAPQVGDINADGIVGADDLLMLLGDWGQVHSSADLNGDGLVEVDDLLLLIVRWT